MILDGDLSEWDVEEIAGGYVFSRGDEQVTALHFELFKFDDGVIAPETPDPERPAEDFFM